MLDLYTIVHVRGSDPALAHAVEELRINGSDREKDLIGQAIDAAGGLVFGSHIEAAEYAMSANYPPSYSGPIAVAPGTFLRLPGILDSEEIYIAPKKEG